MPKRKEREHAPEALSPEQTREALAVLDERRKGQKGTTKAARDYAALLAWARARFGATWNPEEDT